MTTLDRQEKRIYAVLEGHLTPEALSESDIKLLTERVTAAIERKISEHKVIMFDGKARVLQ